MCSFKAGQVQPQGETILATKEGRYWPAWQEASALQVAWAFEKLCGVTESSQWAMTQGLRKSTLVATEHRAAPTETGHGGLGTSFLNSQLSNGPGYVLLGFPI